METTTNPRTQITFYQLFLGTNTRVVIPIIQRDYAQGRATQKNVRSSFLNALYRKLVLDQPENPLDLDFVYGNYRNVDFIPLDGQQRLTTLFLLHWYLAVKEDYTSSFYDTFLDTQKNSRFTYETRVSSGEFCNRLVNSISPIGKIFSEIPEQKCLSEILSDQPWFMSYWRNDPTVTGMLTMLDEMHEKFRDVSVGCYSRLVSDSCITFQFLNLKEFSLTDDLYIKMNARGKPLTSFEIWKARFEKYIEELPGLPLIIPKRGEKGNRLQDILQGR